MSTDSWHSYPKVYNREVHKDLEEECADEIKELLYKWAVKDIKRSVIKGLPEWYKEKLLEKQFNG